MVVMRGLTLRECVSVCMEGLLRKQRVTATLERCLNSRLTLKKKKKKNSQPDTVKKKKNKTEEQPKR